MIDLHTHSYFSDGSLSPEEIVKTALKIGLYAVALTDHDTVDGIERFLKAPGKIHKVAGVEISIAYDKGTFHLLGLFIDHKHDKLKSTLDMLKKYRKERNTIILSKLSNMSGEKINEEDIYSDRKGEISRPHIAHYLISKGIVKDIYEAFDKYLGIGKILYEPKKRLDYKTGLKIIKEAGGITILAHPHTLNLGETTRKTFLLELLDSGLEGIEAYTSTQNKLDTNFYLQFAKNNNVLISSGTDFHGEIKPGIDLGTGKGKSHFDNLIYDKMTDYLKYRK